MSMTPTPHATSCPEHSGLDARLNSLESTQVEIKQRVSKVEDTLDQKIADLSRVVGELSATLRGRGATVDVWTMLAGGGLLAVLSAIISQIIGKFVN